MADKPVKIPGPDHPITIEANSSRVTVTVGGKLIADTRNAVTLREASYPPVQYIPRRDVDMAALTRSEHTTYCPYKGDDPSSVDLGKAGVHQRFYGWPLAWTRTYGEGRVFYTALGHEPSVWQDARYQRILANAILWSMRRSP